MEFATGAMGTLLPKLGELLLDEYQLQKSVKLGIKDLKDELESMQAALRKVSDVPLDQLDPQLKIWANNVRELSYSIEDNLDSYMVRVEGTSQPTEPHTFTGFIDKTRTKIAKFRICHEMATDIKNIQRQVRTVKERYDRYKVDAVVASHATTPPDPRLSAMYNKVSNLVGVDKAIDELMNMLSKESGMSDKKLKTLSIVGFGGLGKTTLAKAAYDRLKMKFECGGFVPAGQKPDMKKLLKDILYEVDKQKYENIIASKMDERQLIDELQGFLADKRYLIVIDDIWDVKTWETITNGLVDTNRGSRIIITTRMYRVAEKVGSVYKIKPLSNENSKKLFYTRIFGGEGINLDDQYTEVTSNILRKCGGVPLSIITIASLLVDKHMDDWSKVYDTIGFGDEDNEAVQNTRKILSFSYYDLPSHLKTCLLHLSTFPEDYWIEKNQLIWRWVAEGFVHDEHGIGLFKLGESYLNELINRSMIRWMEPTGALNVNRGGCRVHDMMLDLIRTFSCEVNFVTIQDRKQSKAFSAGNSVHRLALHKTILKHSPSMEMGRMRSFNAIVCHICRVPPLVCFKALRVLILENCHSHEEGCSLEHLGRLVQLRYLGLRNTPVAVLPGEIGNLKSLQTLDVSHSGIQELPPSVGELRNLMCLCASKGTKMMAEIGKLTSLEELRLYSVDKSPNSATELGKLTEMKFLDIGFDEMDDSTEKALVESLRNLNKIQSLTICHHKKLGLCAGVWGNWTAPSVLRELYLCGITLSKRDLRVLGKLPLLRFLGAFSEAVHQTYTIASGGFQNLRYLITNMNIMCGEGALPMLHVLECKAEVGKHVGLVGNMPLLEDVTYRLHCHGCSVEEVEDAEAALMHAAAIHPNHPTLTIKRECYKPNDPELRKEYLLSPERRRRRVNLCI